MSVGGLQIYSSHQRARFGVRRQESLVIVAADAVCACRPAAETDAAGKYPQCPAQTSDDMDFEVIEGRLSRPATPREASADREKTGPARYGRATWAGKPASQKMGYGSAYSKPVPLGARVDILC